MCNQQFAVEKAQKCAFETRVPNEHTLIYNQCQEEFCFSMLSAVDEEAPTTVLMGCESRSLLKHLQNRVEVKENETAWQLSQPFFSQLRCNQLLNETMEPDANGTVRACVDFGYTDEFDVERLAKLCCCWGSDFCNAEISWATPRRPIERQPPTVEPRAAASGGAESTTTHAISVALTLFSVLFVFERPGGRIV